MKYGIFYSIAEYRAEGKDYIIEFDIPSSAIILDMVKVNNTDMIRYLMEVRKK